LNNSTFGTINPAPLNVNFYFNDKLYDSTQVTRFNTYTISGLFNNDPVTLSSFIALYNDFNTGLSIPISISNVILNDSNNYYISQVNNFGAAIHPFPLNAYGVDKLYDGKKIAEITLSGFFKQDTATYQTTFDSIYVGYNHITISNFVNNNYYVANQPYAYILPFTLTAAFSGIPKLYDGTLIAAVTYTLSGIINNDNVDISSSFVISDFESANIGTYLIDISNIILYGPLAYNYVIASTLNNSTFGTINPAPLNVNFYFNDKLYDSTQVTRFNTYTISGLFNNDPVTLSSFIALYNDFNTGLSIPISISNVILNDSNNYYIGQVNNFGAAIHPFPLNAFGVDKLYDDTNIAQITLSGFFKQDTATYQTTFDNIYIGYNHITISNFVNNNYYVANQPYANILPFPISAAFTGISKIYDGTAIAHVTYTLSGVYNNDLIYLLSDYIISDFESINIGTYPIDISNIQLAGPLSYNYVISSTNKTTGTIYKAPITIVFYFNDKLYDSTQTTIFNSYAINGLFNLDPVTLSSFISYYNSYNASPNVSITVSDVILNADDNYYINNVVNSGAAILPFPLTAYAADKLYDGTNVAPITLSGFFKQDSATYQTSFDSIYVGYNHITISNFVNNNYYVANQPFANILPFTLTAAFTGVTKVYDGTLIAAVTYTLSGIINNDNVDISSSFVISDFESANIGTYLIDISNIILYGPLAYNYFINSIYNNSTFATINPAPLNVNFYFNDKLYDATQVTRFDTYTISGLFNNDPVTLSSYIALYNSINTGLSIPISISYVILNNDNNYYINQVNNFGAAIFPFPLTAFAADKLYDGTNVAPITLS
jgi:thiamine kinase-like enzyme